MAKPFSCWIIVAGSKPTAFRAREADELLPQVRGAPVVPVSGLTGAGVDKFQRAKEKPSDHAPTWVELDMDAVVLPKA